MQVAEAEGSLGVVAANEAAGKNRSGELAANSRHRFPPRVAAFVLR